MKVKVTHAQAAVLVGLCWAVVSGGVYAAGNTALQHAALRKACTDHDGRFEQSWIYNDQGVQWGEVVSCATSAGYIRCQGNRCRSGRWIVRESMTATDARPDDKVGAVQFPAEPASFTAALSALSGK